MTPERWQRVKDLFDSALDRTPAERAAFLAEACADDDDLRAQVEALLSAHAQADSFIEAPAFEEAATLLASRSDEPWAGERIGPYKLIREIGHGGMGAVYLAVRDDDQYQKRVAIKLVKRGMDTAEVLRRFRSERQILAGLEHPNIARLLDGGTTGDRRPYFVMEHIEGLPITEYCDRHQLSTVERLKLFREVCLAVHYAHQCLVVHRDLKPSNILITVEGVPKLLDFGIAKVLIPDFLQTAPPTVAALRPMTPDYASPEQVRGLSITTASDIYSLGVLLYELLTGHRPYRFKDRSLPELERVICEAEPEKPSMAIMRVEEVTRRDRAARGETQPASDATTRLQEAFRPDQAEFVRLTLEFISRMRDSQPAKLRRQLKGDLDNIVLMALRKEPHRRYGSAEQLAEDLRRHLEGLPVIARKDTLAYRTGKLIKRNKAGVTAAALLIVTLLGGLAATLWQARVAKAERARAEQQFNDVRQLATSFLFEFDRAILKLPGATPARELLVKRARETLNKLAQQASHDRTLQLELAVAYGKVGFIQWNRYYANLGDTAGALGSYRQALGIYEQLLAKDPENARARLGAAYVYREGIGDLLAATGDVPGAMENYRQALAINEALVAGDPMNKEFRGDLAISYQRVGDTAGNPGFPNLGDPAGALESYRKMLEIDEALAADPTDRDARHTLSIGYEKMGDMLEATGDLTGALETYRKAQTIREALAAADPLNALIRRDLGFIYGKVASMLAKTNNLAEARQTYHKAVEIREGLVAGDPADAKARRDLVLIYLYGFGDFLAGTGDKLGAAENYRKALRILDGLSADHQAERNDRSNLFWTLQRLANLSLGQGQVAEARRFRERALKVQKALADQPGATADDVNSYAYALVIAEPAELRDPAAALAYAKRAVEMSQEKVHYMLETLSLAYHQLGDQASAVRVGEKALALVPSGSPKYQQYEANLKTFKAARSPQ